MNETATFKTFTAEQVAGMTTTDLLSLLANARLTNREIRIINAEIDSRRI